MELIKLIGILIVIVGFALKLDSILTIMCAAIVTALIGGLGFEGLLTTLGTSFVSNRSMSIFILIMFVTGTLERNGLKEAAAALIGKLKGASAGTVLGAYAVMRGIFGSFNVSFGGVAGFVRPIILPMATAAVEVKVGEEPNEEHVEALKGMSAAVENTIWFFTQVLFIGGSGALLVQSTLASLTFENKVTGELVEGIQVELADLAMVEIPVAIFAIALTVLLVFFRDKKLTKKFYGSAK